MEKKSRTIRLAVALGAAATAVVGSGLISGAANAGYDPCYDWKVEDNVRGYDDCFTPATRPELTTTTAAGATTTTAGETTTTEAPVTPTTEIPVTPTTEIDDTTTTAVDAENEAEVDDATGAAPVAAQASYAG